MSTNTKKKHGTGAAVVLIVLCLLALGTLGYIIWRQFNPVVPETAAGYAPHPLGCGLCGRRRDHRPCV